MVCVNALCISVCRYLCVRTPCVELANERCVQMLVCVKIVYRYDERMLRADTFVRGYRVFLG